MKILITKKMHARSVCDAIGKCYPFVFLFFILFYFLAFASAFPTSQKNKQQPNASADGSLNTSCTIIGSMGARLLNKNKIVCHFSVPHCEFKVNVRLSADCTNDDVTFLPVFNERISLALFPTWTAAVDI